MLRADLCPRPDRRSNPKPFELCSLLGSYLGILDLAQGSRLIRKWPLRAMLSANFPDERDEGSGMILYPHPRRAPGLGEGKNL